MVKSLAKFLTGAGFSVIFMLGLSFVKADTVKACDTSGGVYGCYNVHVANGYDGGPGLAGASVKVEIGPIKSGFYCLAPGRSNTTITTTTNSNGDATIDDICCTSVVQYIRVTITKSGYYAWGPYDLSLSNGPESSINIYLAEIPEPPQPTTNPSNLQVSNDCYGSTNTPSVTFSFTPSSAGGDHYIYVNTSSNLTGAHLVKNVGTGNSFTWNSAHSMEYAGYGAPANTPQNSTTYWWAVYAYANGKQTNGGSFTTNSVADCESPTPPVNATGHLEVRVFNDTNGDGLREFPEDTFLAISDAPATVVRRGSETGSSMHLDSDYPGYLRYESVLDPGSYKVYFKPDPAWLITKYRVKIPDVDGTVHNYSTGSSGYYYTVSVRVEADHHSYADLGVKKEDLPNLTADTIRINNGKTTFVPGAATLVEGYINNIGVAKDLNNITVGFYVDQHIIDSTSISSLIPRVAETTTNLTTTTPRNYVYATPSLTGLLPGDHNLQVCADYSKLIGELRESDNCSPELKFTIAEPQKQWLKTEQGDVGARGNISLDYHPAGANNADYLVITQNALVKNFTSAKNWLVKSYTPLNVYPTASSSYTSLLGLYSKNGIASVGTTEDAVTNHFVGNIGRASGPMTIDSTSWPAPYAGGAKVIFVDGDLNINNNLQIADNTGLIFIVSGTTRIATSVTRVDGVFISYYAFYTTSYPSCAIPLTETHQQLKINGAVYSFGLTCFTRNLGPTEGGPPAELITYEPKYLVLFREALGETVTSFKEVTP